MWNSCHKNRYVWHLYVWWNVHQHWWCIYKRTYVISKGVIYRISYTCISWYIKVGYDNKPCLCLTICACAPGDHTVCFQYCCIVVHANQPCQEHTKMLEQLHSTNICWGRIQQWTHCRIHSPDIVLCKGIGILIL